MDALLIVGGLLLILCGLLWLVSRAFATSLLWGIGSLLPPLTLLFILRHWQRASSALLLIGMGCIPLVVGLTQLASRDADRLAAILSLQWLQPAASETGGLDMRRLHAEFNGRSFSPELGELIGGTLVLREGDDFFARRELSIRLPSYRGGDLRVDVLPEDQGELPEIELSWLKPEQELPEARRIASGYTLHLDLRAVEPNLLRGSLHLVLPPSYRTSLSGEVELYSNRLRYRGERVDTRYDSQDTIAWVISDYLQRSHGSRDVQLVPLPLLDLQAGELQIDVEAWVANRLRRSRIELERSEVHGWRVRGDRAAPLPPPVVRDETEQGAPVPTTVVRGEERPLDRRIGFSLERLIEQPSRYLGARMQVFTERGRSAEGRFSGLNEDGRLVIQRSLGGQGEAQFILRPREVQRIELLEP